jgi:hypothetical protein
LTNIYKMYYISPFHSLGISDFDITDKTSLNLVKKKFLAEIELSPTNTIIKGHQELTKDAVLKTFDNLSQMGNWEAHRAIAKTLPFWLFWKIRHFQKTRYF